MCKVIESSVPSFMCLAVDCRHLNFEGVGSTQQIFILGGSALLSKSLLFYIWFLRQKVTLLWKMVPLSSACSRISQLYPFLMFHFSNTLRILKDSSIIRPGFHYDLGQELWNIVIYREKPFPSRVCIINGQHFSVELCFLVYCSLFLHSL